MERSDVLREAIPFGRSKLKEKGETDHEHDEKVISLQ
jgi:hypothetical protein